ncbi:hypothetical protein ACISRB_14625, partial [Micromonospora aurantiaca]
AVLPVHRVVPPGHLHRVHPDDLEVPGRPYTFAQLQAAQASGDRRALAGRERPVLRLHLTERATGVAQLLETAGRTRT